MSLAKVDESLKRHSSCDGSEWMSLAEVVNWEFWLFGSKQPMFADG